ncbi:MAG: TonB family protein [Myxococcota bacterium]
MFDSVLQRGQTPKSRVGVGGLISVGAHAALVGLVVWFTASGTPAVEEPKPDVKFFATAPARRGPGGPAPSVAPKRAASSAPKKQRRELVQPTRIVAAEEQPREVEDAPSEATDEGGDEGSGEAQEGGLVGGGDPNGTPDGVPGGVGAGTGGTDVLPFGEGMTRPECDRSVFDDIYARSREAREAHIEGSMVVQCEILASGTVQNCRALKPLPHLTEAALEAMTHMTCRPATFQGRPVSIKYSQLFRFQLAR